MQLDSVAIQGYKRFESKTVLYARARATAIVGTNEAGKTSLLQALERITRRGWDGVRDFTDRLTPADPNRDILSARFTLEAEDVIAAQAAIAGRSVLSPIDADLTFTRMK